MKWYWWLSIALLVDLVLLGLSGTGQLPIETVTFFLLFQYVILQWVVALWLLKLIVRWFRSGLRKPVTPPTTDKPPSQ